MSQDPAALASPGTPPASERRRTAPEPPALLSVERLTLRFGGLTAVNDVSFRIEAGLIAAVIGPNGAGKTSLFNAITGIHPASAGRVLFDGVEIEAPWSRRLLWSWIAVGLACGLGAMVLVNLQELWSHGINDLFRPRVPFPLGRSLAAAWDVLAPSAATVLPFLLGGGLGFLGAWRQWSTSRRGPDRVAAAGIGRTFQNIRLFRGLTCLDNVLVGRHGRLQARWWQALLRLPAHRRDEAAGRAVAQELLTFVGLAGLEDAAAAGLPYGHQRRLEIARALALEPRLLLLDEPAAGLNPVESRELMALIRRIRERGVTVLLIEHDMGVVMGVSERIVVLHYGAKIAEGPPEQIRSDPTVIEAYLGSTHTAVPGDRRAEPAKPPATAAIERRTTNGGTESHRRRTEDSQRRHTANLMRTPRPGA